MSKAIKILNPDHPVNKLNVCGKQAKAHARNLSNEALDKLLQDNMTAEDFSITATWTRGQKIKFIRRCAMVKFAKDFTELQPLETKES